MRVVRIITVEGDEEWVKNTIKKSLPEGVNVFGKGGTITVVVKKEEKRVGNTVWKLVCCLWWK